jgi:hypothetical protein
VTDEVSEGRTVVRAWQSAAIYSEEQFYEVDAMFTLIKMLPMQRLLGEQLPVFGIAFIIAEVYYKFHSFALECAAFLATWFVIDAAVQFARRIWPRP